jgi:hypothetical protein
MKNPIRGADASITIVCEKSVSIRDVESGSVLRDG